MRNKGFTLIELLVDSSHGERPVFYLSSNTQLLTDGTSGNPYRIK